MGAKLADVGGRGEMSTIKYIVCRNEITKELIRLLYYLK